MESEDSFGIIPIKNENNAWWAFLVLHKDGNHWSFPKGKKNLGEDDKSAAIRELKEETNLEVTKFLKEFPYQEQYQFRRKGKKIKKTVHYFLAEVHGTPKLQFDEIRDGKWILFDQVISILTFEEARKIFVQVMLLDIFKNR